MLNILGLIAPLFAIIALGYISGRLRKISIDGLAWLNFFVVYIALPALFFLYLSRTPFQEFTRLDFLTRTTLVTFAIFLLCFLIAKLVKRESTEVSAIQGLSGAYGNIGYMGPPIAIAAFGPEAAVPVALIFCLDNTMHFINAPILMGISEKRAGSKLRVVFDITRSIATNSFILATLAGMLAAWYQFVPPVPLESLLTLLAGAAAPCALFAMGVTAALRPVKRIPMELGYLVPIKLFVHPLLMYLVIATLTDLPDHWLYSAVLLSALPTASNVFVLAQRYNVWVERSLSVIVVSTALSVVSVTAIIYFLINSNF